jgi:phage shock protein C
MRDDYISSPNPKRLYRSRDKVIAGVCGGIADRMGWDPTLTRIVAAIMLFGGVGFIIPVYLVIWAITPYQPYRPRNLTPDEERFWTSVSDRPKETFSNIRYKFKDMDDRLARMERAVTSEEWKLRREFRDLEGRENTRALRRLLPAAAPDKAEPTEPQDTRRGTPWLATFRSNCLAPPRCSPLASSASPSARASESFTSTPAT